MNDLEAMSASAERMKCPVREAQYLEVFLLGGRGSPADVSALHS